MRADNVFLSLLSFFVPREQTLLSQSSLCPSGLSASLLNKRVDVRETYKYFQMAEVKRKGVGKV